ncbi:MAG: hypothetical protein AAFX87_07665 [Bacteroidota bacterium]
MSSHHIVRDEQEPALLIIDQNALLYAEIQPLLEWVPTVIVSEDVLPVVIGWQIKIDCVICRKAHIEQIRDELIDQEPYSIITLDAAGDSFTPAFDFLMAKGYTAVNVVSSFENNLPAKLEKWTDKLNLVIYSYGFKWVLAKGRFRKWVNTGQEFSIFSSQELKFSTQGFQHDLSSNSVANSNPLKAKEASHIEISADGSFWLGEKIY